MIGNPMETPITFFDLGRMPTDGERVRVTARLLDTQSMLVAQKYLNARRVGVTGVAVAWVPGHGGELWWVRHDDGAESCYLLTELSPEVNDAQSNTSE